MTPSNIPSLVKCNLSAATLTVKMLCCCAYVTPMIFLGLHHSLFGLYKPNYDKIHYTVHPIIKLAIDV